MPHRWETSRITIIFAEDDLVFREIAQSAITKAGIPDGSIKMADDGQEALIELDALQGGDPDDPIVMLLDMRMPGMDGETCATKVKELKDQGKLKRAPYLVCCSAGVEQVSFADEDGGVFHITMPKPFSDKQVVFVMDEAKEWWMQSTGASGGAPGDFDFSQLRIVIENQEPICRMALATALTTQGVNEDNVVECDDGDQLKEEVFKAQAEDTSLPLLVFLSSNAIASSVRAEFAGSWRPFIVWYSVDAPETPDRDFDFGLKHSCLKESVKAVLDKCKAWWTSR